MTLIQTVWSGFESLPFWVQVLIVGVFAAALGALWGSIYSVLDTLFRLTLGNLGHFPRFLIVAVVAALIYYLARS